MSDQDPERLGGPPGSDADAWARLESLFFALCDVQGAERERLLDERCGEDATLRAELLCLLDADAGGLELLDLPESIAGLAAEALVARRRDPLIGAELGPYRVLEPLGVGGMSTVYLAERADGAFEQRCAVKILRSGLDSESVIERFGRERHMLAQLRHPLITRLLDGGALPDGRPYLVMDFVEGEPIDRYCRRHRPSMRAILRLVIEICGAVEHAHRNLIVHRDIKPANVLVTPGGSPRLLDFGVARLLDPAAGAAPTTVGGRFLTPQYASPEQIEGGAITTAIDVYGLGVLLYEVLAGRHPFASSRSVHEVARAVCEEEPAPPSRWGGPELRGDLDAIVLMALRKDPADRYPSPAALAEDLRRHLEKEPVAARRGRFAYQVQRFLVRRRVPLAASAAIAGLLAASFVGVARERDRALIQEQRTRKVSELMIGLLELPDPVRGRALAQLKTARLAERAAFLTEGEIRGDPELRVRFMTAVGRVMRNLGDLERAWHFFSDASELAEPLGRPELSIELAYRLGELATGTDRFDEARRHAERIRLLAPEMSDAAAWRARALAIDAIVLDKTGQPGALAAARQGLDLVAEQEQPLLASWLLDIAARLPEVEDPSAAAEAAYRLAEASFGADHPVSMDRLESMALAQMRAGRLDEAEARLHEVLEARRVFYGPVHPSLASSYHHLGSLHRRRMDFITAGGWMRQSIEMAEKTHGRRSLHWAESAVVLADILRLRGELAAARDLADEAGAVLAARLGADHRLALYARMVGVSSVIALGESEAADERSEAEWPDGEPAEWLHYRAEHAMSRGDFAAAGSHLEAAESRLPSRRGLNAVHQARLLSRLLLAQGRLEEAGESAREAVELAGQRGTLALRARLAHMEWALAAGRADEVRAAAPVATEEAAASYGQSAPIAVHARLLATLAESSTDGAALRRDAAALPPGDLSPWLRRELAARGLLDGPARAGT